MDEVAARVTGGGIRLSAGSYLLNTPFLLNKGIRNGHLQLGCFTADVLCLCWKHSMDSHRERGHVTVKK